MQRLNPRASLRFVMTVLVMVLSLIFNIEKVQARCKLF